MKTLSSVISVAIAIASACAVSSAFAQSCQVVFDNGVGGPQFVNFISAADVDNPVVSADNFMFDTATTITDVEWSGIYFGEDSPPAVDNFTIAFYADDAGEPAAAPLAEFDVGNAVSRQNPAYPVAGSDLLYTPSSPGVETISSRFSSPSAVSIMTMQASWSFAPCT